MSDYKLKPGKIGNKVIGAYKEIEGKFTETFLMEDESSESGYKLKTGETGKKVTDAFQKIEDGVVGGYKKVEETFVNAFLEKKDE